MKELNYMLLGAFPGGTSGKKNKKKKNKKKNPPSNAGDRCRFDTWVGKIPLEKGMVTHSSILAWRIPWTEEPDGLQSMGWQRVRHD